MKLHSMKAFEAAMTPYYQVAAETVGKGITVERMHRLMAHLKNPEKTLRVVHVAGTSGKTSTTYYIAALLTAAGKKVGHTVSPHMDSVTERVQINGVPLKETEFLEKMGLFLGLVTDAPETPSYFELMMAFALWVFAAETVDYAVIETGMGGLHDASNVCVRADKLCVITDIGLDHQAFLGDTVLQIAAQKAGIIYDYNAVIMYDQSEDVLQAVRFKVSQTEGAELYVQDQQRLAQIYPATDELKQLPLFQQRNWLLAYAAYRFVANRDGFALASTAQTTASMHCTVPGRMDTSEHNGVTVVMDGAHNQPKMTAFVESFQARYGNRKVPVLLAVKEGKDIAAMLPLVVSIASEIIVTCFSISKDWPIEARPPKAVARLLRDIGFTEMKTIPDPKVAFSELLTSGGDPVVVTGSLYLVSAIRSESA